MFDGINTSKNQGLTGTLKIFHLFDHPFFISWLPSIQNFGNEVQGNKPYLKAFPVVKQNSAHLSSAQKMNKNISSFIREEKWQQERSLKTTG